MCSKRAFRTETQAAGEVTLNFSWMSNDQYLAQVGHTFGGLSAVFVLSTFFPAATFYVFGIGIAIAALKEFVFDVAAWGEGDSWSDSAMDFAFYLLGGSTGLGLIILAHHLGR